MAELDKKILKAQTDLVQAVLEAQEKRNLERVDMLLTNAFKQLKMSRFKPDQTTCISLTYLARISPKVFVQSSAIKEILKSSLRRETGPANIKGKNDILLPVLSANILLACCDATEIRLIILNKIEQWLASNQKIADTVQHLLSTICMKCQGDQKTIALLVEMRQNWLNNLEVSVPSDLCVGIRKLLHTESSCTSLINYLRFLIKHDNDLEGLSKELAIFVIERPMSLDSMLSEDDSAVQLVQMILRVFIKLFTILKSSDKIQPEIADTKMDLDEDAEKISSTPIGVIDDSKAPVLPMGVTIKTEPKESIDTSSQCDNKKVEINKLEKDIKSSQNAQQSETTSKAEFVSKADFDCDKTDMVKPTISMTAEEIIIPKLYVKMVESSQVIPLSWPITEAVMRLMILVETNTECKDEFNQLIGFWQSGGTNTTIYQDASLTRPYNLPSSLRQKLIHSSNDYLIELGLQYADVSQLVDLIQQFGLPLTTINRIFKRLNSVGGSKVITPHIKDRTLFYQLLEFYHELGALGAKEFNENLGLKLSTSI